MFVIDISGTEEQPIVTVFDMDPTLDAPEQPVEERSFANVLVDLLFPFNPLFNETFDQLVIVACALDDEAAAELERSFWSVQ